MLIQFIGDEKQNQYKGNGIDVKRGWVIEVTEEQKKQLYEKHSNWWNDKPMTKKTVDRQGKTVPSVPITKPQEKSIAWNNLGGNNVQRL